MGKILINKHTNQPENISESSFTPIVSLKGGEIIICNKSDNPGLFIHSDQEQGILKINDGQNVKLSSAYTPSTEEEPVIVSGESFDSVTGKIVKTIEKIKGSVSRKAVDEIITENLSEEYNITGRTINLKYIDESGTTHVLSEIDVTQFPGGATVLVSARFVKGSEIVPPKEPQNHMFLELGFNVGEGISYIYQDITNIIGSTHIILTAEEYKVLPEAEKNNGSYYYTYEE